MPENIVRIISKPGIKRDGTQLDSDTYVDGQWVRFQRGMPRKIGGYRSINRYLKGLPYTLISYMTGDQTYVHFGSSEFVEQLYMDEAGNTSVVIDRTPASLVADDNNLWQFAVETGNGGADVLLLAQVAPNLECPCATGTGQLFYGVMTASADLVELTTPADLPAGYNAGGGIVALNPYTFFFGEAGYVAWSVPGDPTDYVGVGSGSANITGQKIVKGLPLRGGSNAPSGLFWSIDSLLRASFVGGASIFQFDTISAQTSILSAASVIEYDGIFYWIGVDRFLSFNGVVREVPNPFNTNFFFDNLNYTWRQKVYATKVPRFGEIWWCFPKGDSIEPNHAIVFNVRENYWYDCALPEGGRGAALPADVFRWPLMTGVEPQAYISTGATVTAAGTGYVVTDVLTVSGGQFSIPVELTVSTIGGGGAITAVSVSNSGAYTETPTNPVSVTGGTGTGATFALTFTPPYILWLHENGVDAIDGTSLQPIQSYFETSAISLPVQQQINKGLQVLMMEPDFIQTGDLLVSVQGRANARSNEVDGPVKTLTETASTPQEQVLYFKEQRRELRFRFESNTVGGDYQMGVVLAHVQQGDGTVIG